MLELKIKTGRKHIPIFDLPAALGRAQACREIGDQVDALIAFLDDLGGDPDLEDSEAGMSNIDACGRLLEGSKYSPIHDEDCEPDDDAQGDQSWIEWHTRDTRKTDGGAEVLGRNIDGGHLTEDTEDDDPAEQDDHEGQCDEDGINTALDTVRYTTGASGPGCPISDAGGGNIEDEPQAWFSPVYSLLTAQAIWSRANAANDA